MCSPEGLISRLIFVCMLFLEAAGRAPNPSLVRQCCEHARVRLAMPAFSFDPWWSFDNQTWSGFVPLVIDELAKETGMEIVLTTYNGGWPFPAYWSGDFDFENFDATFTLLENAQSYAPYLLEEVVHTAPFLEADVAFMVARTKANKSMWTLFVPFQLSLWLAIAVSMLVASIIFACTHSLEYGRSSMTCHQLFKATYHAWSLLLGGGDYEFLEWPGRVLKIGILVFACITLPTYTANLAAAFATPSYKVHGPTDWATLRAAKACIAHIQVQDNNAASFVGSLFMPPLEDKYSFAMSPAEMQEFCFNALHNGEASVTINYMLAHTLFSQSHCDSTAIVPGLSIAGTRLGLGFHRNKSALANNLSQAIVHLHRQEIWNTLLSESFGIGQPCKTEDISSGDSNVVPVDFQDMSGLFVITGSIACLSLALAMCRRCKWSSAKKVDTDDAGNGVDDFGASHGEMLREILHLLRARKSVVAYDVHCQNSASSANSAFDGNHRTLSFQSI